MVNSIEDTGICGKWKNAGKSAFASKIMRKFPFTNGRKSAKIADGLDEPPAQAYDHSDGALRRQAIALINAMPSHRKKMEEFP